MELTEDIKGLTAGVSSRKRGKRRYFWEYSEQLTPSKQERMLKPSEWDRHTLPSNLYQKNGPLHGIYIFFICIFCLSSGICVQIYSVKFYSKLFFFLQSQTGSCLITGLVTNREETVVSSVQKAFGQPKNNWW